MAKKVPQRQCIACRVMKAKSDLLRITKNSKGEITIDLIGKMPGRGSYLCFEENCFKKTQKSKALERNFSTSISPEVYQELELSLIKRRSEVNTT